MINWIQVYNKNELRLFLIVYFEMKLLQIKYWIYFLMFYIMIISLTLNFGLIGIILFLFKEDTCTYLYKYEYMYIVHHFC